jgi:hypothetical protein
MKLEELYAGIMSFTNKTLYINLLGIVVGTFWLQRKLASELDTVYKDFLKKKPIC